MKHNDNTIGIMTLFVNIAEFLDNTYMYNMLSKLNVKIVILFLQQR